MSLGDSEHPIGFSFVPELRGEHVHVAVRSGIPGMRALCGTLVLRIEEWGVLRAALATYPYEPLELLVLPGPSRPNDRLYKRVNIAPFEFSEIAADTKEST